MRPRLSAAEAICPAIANRAMTDPQPHQPSPHGTFLLLHWQTVVVDGIGNQ